MISCVYDVIKSHIDNCASCGKECVHGKTQATYTNLLKTIKLACYNCKDPKTNDPNPPRMVESMQPSKAQTNKYL